MRALGIIRVSLFIYFLLAVLHQPIFAQAAEYKCKILANSTPPLSIVSGNTVTGFSIDLLREIFDRAALDLSKCDITPVSWARGIHELQNMRHRIMFSVARTPERAAHFKWVGPIYRFNMSLIGKKFNQFKISSYDDVKRYNIGTLKQSAPEKILINNGISANKLKRVTKVIVNIRKLEHGRIDLVAHVLAPLKYEMRELHLNPDDYEEVFIIGSTELYYAFSLDTPDSLIQRLQLSMDQIRKERQNNGKTFYQDLLDKYHLQDPF